MKPSNHSWTFSDTPIERNLLWSMAITILPVAASFVVSWVIARWAGPDVIGIVSWAMAFATACLIVGKFGIDVAVSRLGSEYGVKEPDRLRMLFRNGLELRLFFTVPVAILIFLFARQIAVFFNDPALTFPLRVSAGVVFCASVYEYNENFLVGLNRFSAVYRVRSIHLLTRIGLIIAIVSYGLGSGEILGGYCSAWMIGILLFLYLLWRNLPEEGNAKRDDISLRKQIFMLSVPLAVSTASVTIYSHTDKIMLGYFSGTWEVGQYTIGRNIAEVSLFPAFAVIMTLRPALASRFAKGERDKCAAIAGKTLSLSLVSGVGFAALFAAFAEPLVIFVFSDKFLPAGSLMRWFIWVILLRSLGAIILPALIAAERAKRYAVLTALTAGLNIGLNIILIPHMNSRGAILSTILSYSILLGCGLYEVSKAFDMRFSPSGLFLALRTIVAGALSVGFIRLFCENPTPKVPILLWSLALGGVYLLLLFLLRIIKIQEVRDLKDRLITAN